MRNMQLDIKGPVIIYGRGDRVQITFYKKIFAAHQTSHDNFSTPTLDIRVFQCRIN